MNLLETLITRLMEAVELECEGLPISRNQAANVMTKMLTGNDQLNYQPIPLAITTHVYRNDKARSKALAEARFGDGRSSTESFFFEGHRWKYQHTSFDDDGDYDVIYRFGFQDASPSKDELPASEKRTFYDGVIASALIAEKFTASQWISHDIETGRFPSHSEIGAAIGNRIRALIHEGENS